MNTEAPELVVGTTNPLVDATVTVQLRPPEVAVSIYDGTGWVLRQPSDFSALATHYREPMKLPRWEGRYVSPGEASP